MRFKLVEAVSPSMPEIIKNLVLKNKYIRNRLLNSGIDIATANFQHYPQPTSSRDPIFKHDDTKEIFFTFPSMPDKVYIKGFNDDSDSFVPDKNRWNSMKPWKYVSAKDMIENGVDVWFVDKTETGVESRVAKERTKRANYGLAQDPNRRFDLKDLARNRSSYSSYSNDENRDPSGIRRAFNSKINGDSWRLDAGRIDKSGYLRDPNKYLDKLKNSPNYRPDKKMVSDIETLHDEIEALNSRIINGAASFSNEEIFSNYNSPINNFRAAMSDIADAIGQYNNAVSRLKNLSDYLDAQQTNRDMYEIKRYTDRIKNSLSSARTSCESAKRNMASWLTTIVDWDTDDYVDDGL